MVGRVWTERVKKEENAYTTETTNTSDQRDGWRGDKQTRHHPAITPRPTPMKDHPDTRGRYQPTQPTNARVNADIVTGEPMHEGRQPSTHVHEKSSERPPAGWPKVL